MTDKIKREARARAAATGESYTRARRAITGPAAAAAVIDPALLIPYPDEKNVTAEELGWRALPADAGPERRAHAEAIWRPVRADRPCRCSGPCRHGEACGEEHAGDGGQLAPCGGHIIHVDRYPGSMFEVTSWQDDYECDSCNDVWTASVHLPSIPWGEQRTDQAAVHSTTTIYPGVRHPNFPDDDSEDYYDGTCPDCSNIDDRCTCYRDDAGCPECGAGGSGDPYGECVCYPE